MKAITPRFRSLTTLLIAVAALAAGPRAFSESRQPVGLIKGIGNLITGRTTLAESNIGREYYDHSSHLISTERYSRDTDRFGSPLIGSPQTVGSVYRDDVALDYLIDHHKRYGRLPAIRYPASLEYIRRGGELVPSGERDLPGPVDWSSGSLDSGRPGEVPVGFFRRIEMDASAWEMAPDPSRPWDFPAVRRINGRFVLS